MSLTKKELKIQGEITTRNFHDFYQGLTSW